jgi:hypothetical protein
MERLRSISTITKDELNTMTRYNQDVKSKIVMQMEINRKLNPIPPMAKASSFKMDTRMGNPKRLGPNIEKATKPIQMTQIQQPVLSPKESLKDNARPLLNQNPKKTKKKYKQPYQHQFSFAKKTQKAKVLFHFNYQLIYALFLLFGFY